jgi:hypothetical protein
VAYNYVLFVGTLAGDHKNTLPLLVQPHNIKLLKKIVSEAWEWYQLLNMSGFCEYAEGAVVSLQDFFLLLAE